VKRIFTVVCIAGLIASALVLSGCTSGNVKLLQAHPWTVTKLGSEVYRGQAKITATFSGGQISGSTGVNSYSGSYKSGGGNAISISNVAMTQIAGSPEAMAAEQQFVKALQAAASYAVDEDSLTLFDSTGAALVVFSAGK